MGLEANAAGQLVRMMTTSNESPSHITYAIYRRDDRTFYGIRLASSRTRIRVFAKQPFDLFSGQSRQGALPSRRFGQRQLVGRGFFYVSRLILKSEQPPWKTLTLIADGRMRWDW